jgi:RNase H-fold protein (predicted Holliday junction resolvase)
MAERAVRGSGLRKTEREDKTRVDAAAAAIILQSYLNTHRIHDLHKERRGVDE